MEFRFNHVSVLRAVSFLFCSFSTLVKKVVYNESISSHRFLTFCYLAVFHLWLLVCPSTLSHDWQMGSIPLVTSLSDYRNLASCLLFVSCFWVGYKILNDIDVSVCQLFTWVLVTNPQGLLAKENTIMLT